MRCQNLITGACGILIVSRQIWDEESGPTGDKVGRLVRVACRVINAYCGEHCGWDISCQLHAPFAPRKSILSASGGTVKFVPKKRPTSALWLHVATTVRYIYVGFPILSCLRRTIAIRSDQFQQHYIYTKSSLPRQRNRLIDMRIRRTETMRLVSLGPYYEGLLELNITERHQRNPHKL